MIIVMTSSGLPSELLHDGPEAELYANQFFICSSSPSGRPRSPRRARPEALADCTACICCLVLVLSV